MTIFGYILIVIGIFSLAFTVLLYFDSFKLMEHLSESDQYLMAAVLAILFVSIGIMVIKQQPNDWK